MLSTNEMVDAIAQRQLERTQERGGDVMFPGAWLAKCRQRLFDGEVESPGFVERAYRNLDTVQPARGEVAHRKYSGSVLSKRDDAIGLAQHMLSQGQWREGCWITSWAPHAVVRFLADEFGAELADEAVAVVESGRVFLNGSRVYEPQRITTEPPPMPTAWRRPDATPLPTIEELMAS